MSTKTTARKRIITGEAGRPYGHVPGHDYLDVTISADPARLLATLTIVWGSAQGHDEEHGREEYTERGSNVTDAILCVRDTALAEWPAESDGRRYINAAASAAVKAGA